MLGVLIASANPAVRRSLVAILDGEAAVYEVSSVGEALSRAGAERMDVIFFDDEFNDGNADQLAARLRDLEYGYEMVPLVPSDEERYMRRFRALGIRHALTKPFNVQRVQRVLAQIEDLATALNTPADAQDTAPPGETPPPSPSEHFASASHVHAPPREPIREVSYRFRRLLSRSLDKESLISTFIEALQEQFETDHVVLLLPASDAPCYRVVSGRHYQHSEPAYGLSMGDPLLAHVIRSGRPVSLVDTAGMDAHQRLKAHRISERLGIRFLCPVLSGGQAMALVGIGVLAQGEFGTDYATLRLFISFFAKALENAELHRRVASAESTYHGVFEGLPVGAVAAGSDGVVRAINEKATGLLGISAADVLLQPVEKLGSEVADVVRNALVTGQPEAPRRVRTGGGEQLLQAIPTGGDAAQGVTLTVREAVSSEATETPPPPAETGNRELLAGLARVLAHNFKNAMVPIRTCAELLPERYHIEGFRSSFFSVVEENTRHIDEWINRLLDFCETSASAETRQTVPVSELVRDALEEAIPDREAAGINVEQSVDPSLAVNGHASALTRSLTEAINNAVDGLQECANPRISVRVEEGPSQTVRIVIEDNGSGVPEADRERCFSPFFTNKLSGLGLGLAFVRRVVREHNGTVELSSGDPAGTCLAIALPAVPVQAPVL